MSRRPHIIVLHRWRDAYAHYDRYLDHDRYLVSYVTAKIDAAGVPAAGQVAPLDATDDVDHVMKAQVVLRLAQRPGAQRHGPGQRARRPQGGRPAGRRGAGAAVAPPGTDTRKLAAFRDKLLMAGSSRPPASPCPTRCPLWTRPPCARTVPRTAGQWSSHASAAPARAWSCSSTTSDGGSVRCTFLEGGARIGGAEIPFVWREVHGYDLMDAAFRDPNGEVAGRLLVPATTLRPCVSEAATSVLGRDPGPYAEVVPRPGDVLPAADAYCEHVRARYRFRGRDTATVMAAVRAAAGGVR